MIREEMKKEVNKSHEGRILARTVARELDASELKKVSGAGCTNAPISDRDLDVRW